MFDPAGILYAVGGPLLLVSFGLGLAHLRARTRRALALSQAPDSALEGAGPYRSVVAGDMSTANAPPSSTPRLVFSILWIALAVTVSWWAPTTLPSMPGLVAGLWVLSAGWPTWLWVSAPKRSWTILLLGLLPLAAEVVLGLYQVPLKGAVLMAGVLLPLLFTMSVVAHPSLARRAIPPTR